MSELREIQLCELEMLIAVKELCEKHHLTYYLSCGTLLGAIRHDGFIPWDDDIDVEMPTEDYKKFLKIAEKELPEKFTLQTFYSDPGYNEMWAKIRANGTTSMPIVWKKLDIHWGICIDIFPLVGIYNNRILKKLQQKSLGLCRTLLAKDFIIASGSNEIEKNKKLKMIYALPCKTRIAMCKFLSGIVLHGTKKSEELALVDTKLLCNMQSSFYKNGTMHKFENCLFSIPKEYDLVLKQWYGDYMQLPPVEERNGHINSLGKIIFDCKKDYSEYK